MIKKENNKYVIRSKEGKKLGSYDTEKEAKKRLSEIEYFKNKDKYADGGMTNTATSMSSILKNSYSSDKKATKKDVLKSMANKYKDGGTKKDDMPCNKPKSDRSGSGKKKVVKACKDGKEKLIRYGADGYRHNYSKKAKKSFRARHKCDSANDKLSARYWACKDLWGKNKKIK